MPDCFKFKKYDISLTLIWATLPVLPLEYWHLNALGKIGLRLGTPIAMDSLTMKMKRVSYPRILVEVDASTKLVDQVEFVMPNDFCTECNCFGHLNKSCQGNHPPPATATTTLPVTVKLVATKKVQPAEWTLVQLRNKGDQKNQSSVGRIPKPTMGVHQATTPTVGNDDKGQLGMSTRQPSLKRQRQPMPLQQTEKEAHSLADSFGSSKEPDSPTSAQHAMSGPETVLTASNGHKFKKQQGGETPLNPHESWLLSLDTIIIHREVAISMGFAPLAKNLQLELVRSE
ncbi:UNVERIFIED_CONTAM: hypothetical protein Sindi_1452100 [Sesamum indicum]